MSSIRKIYYYLTCKEHIETIVDSEDRLQYDEKFGVYRGSLSSDTQSEHKISASPLKINRALRRQIQFSTTVKKD